MALILLGAGLGMGSGTDAFDTRFLSAWKVSWRCGLVLSMWSEVIENLTEEREGTLNNQLFALIIHDYSSILLPDYFSEYREHIVTTEWKEQS